MVGVGGGLGAGLIFSRKGWQQIKRAINEICTTNEIKNFFENIVSHNLKILVFLRIAIIISCSPRI